MFSTNSRRPFASILLVLSLLWVAVTFLPLFYSVVFPDDDLQNVVRALEESGVAPPEAADVVQETISRTGPLTKAVQVGYFTGMTTTLRLHGSKAEKMKQMSYLAWFEKLPKPIILMVTRSENDGARVSYAIDEGEPAAYIQGYSLPLVLLAFSSYLVRRRKSPKSYKRASAVGSSSDL